MNKILIIAISLLLGLIFSLLIGFIFIPIFKNKNVRQSVSQKINERHIKKSGTPTMGGIIFVLSTILVFFILLSFKKIEYNSNVLGIIISFILYAFLGFSDDYLKISKKNNEGLSIINKFIVELFISLVFFLLFLLNGNDTKFFNIDFKYIYGFLMFFIMVGCSNAVNITDGLDGLAAGLCVIAFFTYGIIAYNMPFIAGHEQIAIFCMILSGALIGFLFFNFYPAKIFMGDLGSLALGGALASVAVTLRCEESLIILGIVFITETLSSFIQIIFIKKFNKKIFLKSPLHHHFEELGYEETDIIKLFYIVEVCAALSAIIIYIIL